MEGHIDVGGESHGDIKEWCLRQGHLCTGPELGEIVKNHIMEIVKNHIMELSD